MAEKKKKYTLAFDPGLKNLAAWAGDISPDGERPVTVHLERFDIKGDGSKALYETAVDLVLSTDWMSDPDAVEEAVVETQAPKNIPARIVATAIYGALRGRGIKTCFSGSSLKNKAMATLSKSTGHVLLDKPAKLVKEAGDKDRASRRRIMHKVNKLNSVGLVSRLIDSSLWPDSKKDDLADAVLLGMGLCLARSTKERKPRTKRKQQRVEVGQKTVFDYLQKKKEEDE